MLNPLRVRTDWDNGLLADSPAHQLCHVFDEMDDALGPDDGVLLVLLRDRRLACDLSRKNAGIFGVRADLLDESVAKARRGAPPCGGQASRLEPFFERLARAERELPWRRGGRSLARRLGRAGRFPPRRGVRHSSRPWPNEAMSIHFVGGAPMARVKSSSLASFGVAVAAIR
jgi:hypothetical protein